MYLSDVLVGIARRWYVVVVGLLATGALCWGAILVVPVQYVATSSLLILPPASTVGTGGNPYLALGGLQSAADVLARALTDSTVTERIAPQSGKASYTVVSDHSTSGPILDIEVTDVTGGGAISKLGAVLGEAPAILHKLQTDVGAPSTTMMTVATITKDAVAQSQNKSQLRAVILAGVVGLAVTFFGANLLDAFLLRRAARRSGQTASDIVALTQESPDLLPDQPSAGRDARIQAEPARASRGD